MNNVLHLCAFEMRMATLLFADENAPEWAFSKRKGVKVCLDVIRKQCQLYFIFMNIMKYCDVFAYQWNNGILL